MKNRFGSTTYDIIISELENFRDDAGSDQTNREIFDRPHKTPQTILKIYGQSRNEYKQYLQIYFRHNLLVMFTYQKLNTANPNEVR